MTDTGSATAASGPEKRSLTSHGDLLASMHLSTLMVVAGAAMVFVVIGAEYFSAYPYYGLNQLLAIAGGVGLMSVGAALDVRAGRRSLAETLRFWSIAALVALIGFVFAIYQLETRAFCEFVAPLIVVGFIINHYLPAGLRKPFFVLLSLTGVAGVFGFASPIAAIALVAVGLALIGICHLPVPMWIRIAILIAVTALLAALRIGWMYEGWIAAILPILGSIFMFRLALYLYDISNGKGPKDFWTSVGYFFMLPNLVFSFFPVVDSAAWTRTYYNEDALRIYRRGASYILRGLIHLLLYRVVQVYFVMAHDQIVDGITFMQHITSNFALYLRISGLFHLIVGLLLLFGYNLPETHSRFYFSNSFIDFWRRINIYWKDFMQKMVFNPSYMMFKKIGVRHLTGVVLSMAVVFILTWALHAYQWFWLSGTALFTPTDILFWTILGVFLIAQTLIEARPKKQTSGGLLGPRAFLVVRTVSTMFTICLLWSFWTSAAIEDWVDIVARSGLVIGFTDPAAADVAGWVTTVASLAIVAFAVLVTTGVTFGLPKPVNAAPKKRLKPATAQMPAAFYGAIAAAAAPVLVLGALQIPAISSFVGERDELATKVLTGIDMSQGDIAMMDRGYYEGLAGNGTTTGELDEFLSGRANRASVNEPIPADAGFRVREDYLLREFLPNAKGTVGGAPFETNRWGFYDRNYEQKKPSGVYRIALLGDSRGMGWGVPYEQRFETLLENKLNKSGLIGGYSKYEILNFSLYAYNPIQRLMVLDQKALEFEPDMVIYIGGQLDFTQDHTARMVKRGVAMPYPFIQKVVDEAGLKRDMSMTELQKRLEPYTMELVNASFGQIVHRLKERGIEPVWIEVPAAADHTRDIPALVKAAEAAGFATFDLSGKIDAQGYRISRWDGHYNAEGNRHLADLMYEDLKKLTISGTRK